ncbi:MAG: SDR family oxidoreductase [Ezakiella sp.]|nr:SDR family oxidoreductase [Ezakiella sp.]MDD7472304.1 SDR family oxidoreductase [Bacillota bacterium]MDY3923041.1 SDR family oxidoreductase [Ezakiella sp.]
MKYILITGASGGIGYKVAEKFLNDTDYRVILQYNTGVHKIAELEKKFPYRIESHKVNFNLETEVEGFRKTLKKYKHIDYLVVSSGISKISTINFLSDESLNEIIEVNLKVPIKITKTVSEKMVHNEFGKIVMIASIWGMTGASCESVYSATKAGIISFANSLAKELGSSNINVNTISPGFIDTDMNFEISTTDRDIFLNEVPERRAGTPEEVANAIFFLLSNEANYINGTNLKIDGGYL